MVSVNVSREQALYFESEKTATLLHEQVKRLEEETAFLEETIAIAPAHNRAEYEAQLVKLKAELDQLKQNCKEMDESLARLRAFVKL